MILSNKHTKEEIISYLLENESAFGILITLMLFGSENLLNLSRRLQKKPNSLIYHIQKLNEYELLEIDNQKSNLPGKYYNPSPKAIEIMNNDLTTFFDDLESKITNLLASEESYVDKIPEFTHLISGIMNFTKIMSNLWVSNLEPEKISIKGGKLYKENNPIGRTLLYVDMFNVEDEEDDKKIHNATQKYLKEMNEISKEIEKKYKYNSNNENSNNDVFSNARKFRFIYNFSALFDRT